MIPTLFSGLVARWPLTLACLAIAAGLAIAAAKTYGQHFWVIQGSTIYTPLPIPQEINGDYEPPSPQTLITLAKSPSCLNAVAKDFGLAVPVRTLDKTLKVEKPYNADAFSISLEWPDPKVGCQIVDHVMQVHAKEVAAIRRQKITTAIEHLRTVRAARAQDLAQVKVEYERETGRTTPADLRVEWEHASKNLTTRAADLELARGLLEKCDRDLARCAEREKSLGSNPSLGFEPADTNAPYRQRKEQITDQIRLEEQQLQEAISQIPTKEREVLALRKLSEASAISPLELERYESDLNLLTTQRDNSNRAIEQLRHELSNLPRLQIQGERAEFERERSVLATKLTAAERGLEASRQELNRLGGLINSEQQLAEKIEQTTQEIRRLDARINGLDRLAHESVAEFVVAQPAMATETPTTSNRKSIAALTFVGIASIGLLGLILTNRPPSGSDSNHRGSSLAVLALAPENLPGRSGLLSTRRAAHRLREHLTDDDGIVLVAPEEGSIETSDLVDSVARTLALAGESVLILDVSLEGANNPSDKRQVVLSDGRETLAAAYPSQNGTRDVDEVTLSPATGENYSPSGLHHILQLERDDETGCVRPTGLFGVDSLSVVSNSPDPEILASAAMNRLMRRAAERYTRILVVGQALTDPLGVEIMAGYADGVVLCIRTDSEDRLETLETVAAFRRAGVPWVRSIIR